MATTSRKMYPISFASKIRGNSSVSTSGSLSQNISDVFTYTGSDDTKEWWNYQNNNKFFMKFGAWPNSLRHNWIKWMYFNGYYRAYETASLSSYTGSIYAFITETYDTSSLASSNPKPIAYDDYSGWYFVANTNNSPETADIDNFFSLFDDSEEGLYFEKLDSDEKAVAFLQSSSRTIALVAPSKNGSKVNLAIYTTEASSSRRPYVEVYYDTEKVHSAFELKSGPTSGYVDPRYSFKVSWSLVNSPAWHLCYAGFTQQSAVFHWRETGGSWNTIEINSSTKSVTVPANTLPIGSIEWYVTVVDDEDETVQSQTYTITTADTTAYAAPQAPKGTIEASDKPITFTWSVTNSSGSTPAGSQLQYSYDGETWTDLATISGAEKTYTAYASLFNVGTVWWRARAMNKDEVYGPWSNAVSFISLRAPDMPSVSVDGAPFTTITWQSDISQQAYEIVVDGQSLGVEFGTSREYKLSEHLEDGDHTIAVRYQGSYGLWSGYRTVGFSVENVPGDPIMLTASFDVDAVLSWYTDRQEGSFSVYRDGKKIASVRGRSFSDRIVLGEHTYYVLNALENGNYTKSNAIRGTMLSCVTRIAPAAGGAWIELKLSENSEGEQFFSYSRTASLRHMLGSRYPVLEFSTFEDLTGSYDVAFDDAVRAKAFEALFGQVVILKSRGGNVLIGPLVQVSKSTKDFYISFTFTVQQIEWEDYYDDPNG